MSRRDDEQTRSSQLINKWPLWENVAETELRTQWIGTEKLQAWNFERGMYSRLMGLESISGKFGGFGIIYELKPRRYK